MSISGFIFALFVLVRIVISYFDDLEDVNDTVGEDVKLRKKLPVKYISNGIELNESIRRHYYKVLDIHSRPIINNEVIYEKYHRHLQYLREDQVLGYKIKYFLFDLKAAQYYLDDLCEYFGNLN
jgi:hypothetical protein